MLLVFMNVVVKRMCVCAVYWLAIMAPYLPMVRRAVGRPSPSREGLSATVIVALFPAPFPTCLSASARSAQHG